MEAISEILEIAINWIKNINIELAIGIIGLIFLILNRFLALKTLFNRGEKKIRKEIFRLEKEFSLISDVAKALLETELLKVEQNLKNQFLDDATKEKLKHEEKKLKNQLSIIKSLEKKETPPKIDSASVKKEKKNIIKKIAGY